MSKPIVFIYAVGKELHISSTGPVKVVIHDDNSFTEHKGQLYIDQPHVFDIDESDTIHNLRDGLPIEEVKNQFILDAIIDQLDIIQKEHHETTEDEPDMEIDIKVDF